ncbi:hypothetical protein DCS_04787 [Drechmeria coniospora]|uniref:Uncharacterized protein n=1 Tax=Drechmeria coniospora TaxID=98403 RepID=A0A151GKY6_DRECN|nr:hypothetical protein DCS_04787 [Drechmeria coniospora]KYK57774.1 hypothetical protein DCS_04787 [Drechmeria coniospora]
MRTPSDEEESIFTVHLRINIRMSRARSPVGMAACSRRPAIPWYKAAQDSSEMLMSILVQNYSVRCNYGVYAASVWTRARMRSHSKAGDAESVLCRVVSCHVVSDRRSTIQLDLLRSGTCYDAPTVPGTSAGRRHMDLMNLGRRSARRAETSSLGASSDLSAPTTPSVACGRTCRPSSAPTSLPSVSPPPFPSLPRPFPLLCQAPGGRDRETWRASTPGPNRPAQSTVFRGSDRPLVGPWHDPRSSPAVRPSRPVARADDGGSEQDDAEHCLCPSRSASVDRGARDVPVRSRAVRLSVIVIVIVIVSLTVTKSPVTTRPPDFGLACPKLDRRARIATGASQTSGPPLTAELASFVFRYSNPPRALPSKPEFLRGRRPLHPVPPCQSWAAHRNRRRPAHPTASLASS